jgi:hypothetical protein
MGMRAILGGVAAVLLASCASAPTGQALAPPCTFLRFEQAGAVVPPSGAGTVTLARAPFEVAYVGPGKALGIHVAAKRTLAGALERLKRAEVWVPMGVGMAASPGEILLDEKVQVYRDQGERRAVHALVAPRLWPLVRAKAEARPLDVAVRTGLNVAREPGHEGGTSVYRVRSIDGAPIEVTPHATLYFTAFGETESIAAGQVQIPMLSRAPWNGCTVHFRL